MKILVAKVAKIDAGISKALTAGYLKVVATGNGSPCLDLSRVSEDLCAASEKVDLVVVEGMGRAIQ